MATPDIRRAHPADLPALYRICHATGLSGQDASREVSDPDLIGHVYVGPYAVLEPECAFVALRRAEVVGYIVGTYDTIAFHRRSEQDWFPELRRRYPSPESRDESPAGFFRRMLHTGHRPPPNLDLAAYPAHLHINLLPQAQGHGLGKQLLERLYSELRARGVPGVHLFVAKANPNAVHFYEHVGFTRLADVPGALGYGRRLV